jgi:hypothetical protein
MLSRGMAVALVLASFLAGCSWFGGSDHADSDTASKTNPYIPYNPQAADTSDSGGFMKSLFGFGDSKKDTKSAASAPTGVGVNSYLWRATLDTVSFMPLASADPFGGVIITDWYSPAETPNERFKVNVFILGRELRADGVRCTVFRQKRDGTGQWADAPVEAKTGQDIENAILMRARQMRLSTASTK